MTSRKKRRQGGYLLVEVMTITMVAPVLLLGLAAFFVIFTQDVPRGIRTVHENTTCLNMVAHVRADVQAARSLELHADDNTPVIQIGDEKVSYESADGIVHRTVTASDLPEPVTTHTWKLPHARIQWKLLGGGQTRGLAVSTYVQQKERGDRILTKLANSHVFFPCTIDQAVTQ